MWYIIDQQSVHVYCHHSLNGSRASYVIFSAGYRIQFRLCVLTYRCLNDTAPPYLAESLQPAADVSARQRLRSAATSTLIVPSTRRSTLGDRAFPVAAPRAWNALPLSVRASSSLEIFRRELKTTLFKRSFPDDC